MAAPEKEENKGEIKFEVKPPQGTRDFGLEQIAIRRMVIDTVVSVFKKHRGVELDTPVFELKEVLTGKTDRTLSLYTINRTRGG